MLDFLLLYLIRYKGRSNNSHKIFPEFFWIELFAINKGVCLPGQGWDYIGGVYPGGVPGMSCFLNQVHLFTM